MKRLFSFVLAALMLLTLTACGSGSEQADRPAQTEAPAAPVETAAPTAAPTEAPTEAPAPAALESSGTLGDYAVEIGECELCRDYSGKPALLVNYTFTNNSEENCSGMLALNTDAYQNGLQLDVAMIMDSSIYSAEDGMKEIQPGATISLKAAFSLNSETAPVEFEVSEVFSIGDDKLGKVFEISEGGETVYSVAPGAESAEDLGDYAVSVISHELARDYDGNAALVVTYGFTNNSRDTRSFLFAIEANAFQDGIELEMAVIGDSSLVDSGSQMRNVRPGAGQAVTVAYLLTSETSPVELEISEYMSFSDDKIEMTIDLA